MKYTLIAENTWDGSKTTREFEVDALPEVLSEVELFLRGVGFFFDGNLDFVNDFAEPEYNEDWDIPQDYDNTGLPNNGWPFAAPHPKAPDEWTQTLREDALAEGAGSNVEFGGAGNIHSQYYFDTERNK
jgi:hypothetical protein